MSLLDFVLIWAFAIGCAIAVWWCRMPIEDDGDDDSLNP